MAKQAKDVLLQTVGDPIFIKNGKYKVVLTDDTVEELILRRLNDIYVELGSKPPAELLHIHELDLESRGYKKANNRNSVEKALNDKYGGQ